MVDAEPDSIPATTTWRVVFFTVNLTVSLLFVAMCVGSICETLMGNGSPFALLGGICFVWPAIAFGVAEWALHVRNVRRLASPLGIACGRVGVLGLFALVSNAIEAAVDGSSPGVGFWLAFGGICISVAAYGLWCCWLRCRLRTMPEPRGFPVIQFKGDGK
jgi:hypothetical protein